MIQKQNSMTDISFKPKHETCPLCKSHEINFLYTIEDYDVPFTVDRCGQCGFIFMDPPPHEDSIHELYSEDYYTGRADYAYHDERKTKKYAAHVWDKRIKCIHRYVPGGNFLDVGSSFGGLMKSAETYYTPYGIELSPYSGEHARKKFGDRVHIGTLDDHPFSHDFFSVITMIELIEHTEDPVSVLSECYRLLRDNGLLVIQTANMAARQAASAKENYHYFMPGHLSYFTAQNLSDTLKRTGFRKTRIFYPVEFGLLPKLLKSRGSFTKCTDYGSWARISLYHLKSKVHFKNFAMTSSMVIYAFK